MNYLKTALRILIVAPLLAVSMATGALAIALLAALADSKTKSKKS